MNLILVEPGDFDERGRVVLDRRRSRHVHEVLGAKPGDSVRLGVVRGPRGTGRILPAAGSDRVLLAPAWDTAPEAMPAVDLILAMPRPKVLSRVLQVAACMGVGRIDVVNAWRVDKSYLYSAQLAPGRLRHDLLLGCEQGGTTWVPDIEVHRLLMPFLRGPLSDRLEHSPVRTLIAHPRASQFPEQILHSEAHQRITVAVGPERGWIDRELRSFRDLGFDDVRLGDRVLHVTTAVAALLAQLSLLQRQWR